MEVLNENPLVEIYDDFLSEKELDIFTMEVSKYPYETGQTVDDYGIDHDVDFKVQVDIDNVDNKIVDDFQTIIDITGLATDKKDYIAVFF